MLSDDELIRRALPYTKTGETRLRATLAAIHRVDREGIEGDFVECGVWKGGHSVLVRMASPHRRCWLYDTFEGMTKPSTFDITRSGRSAAKKYPIKMKSGGKWTGIPLDEVRSNLFKSGVMDESLIKIIVGDVCRTLHMPGNTPDKIAVLRLDTDWYESTKTELEVLWPLLERRGELIVDDYGHWLGAKKAVDEYFGFNIRQWNKTDYTQVTAVKAEGGVALVRC